MKKTIYIEIPVEVEWDYTPGEQECTSGPAHNWHQGSDDEVDIISATIGGIDILSALADAEQVTLQAVCFEESKEAAESAREDYECDRAERQYEAAMADAESFLP